MKEPYGKGVANHLDPEPYAVSREAGGGAMARARIGWVLSSAIAIVGGATSSRQAEGNNQHVAMQELEPPGVGDPMHVRNHPLLELGDL